MCDPTRRIPRRGAFVGVSRQAGISIVEVLAVTAVVGIAVVGVALMFGKGSAWVAAIGADRVAAGLAQQRIEQIRAGGWNSDLAVPGATIEESVRPSGVGDPGTKAFRRLTCVQHVDGSTPQGLIALPVDAGCTDGTPSATRRITVTVYPVGGDGSAGAPQTPDSTPVVLQAWITDPAQ